MGVEMHAVSSELIPREGEYDVVCHHCSCSVDSLHQSVSERNADSPRSPASQTKCPSCFGNPPEVSASLPEELKASRKLPLPAFTDSPHNAVRHSPFGSKLDEHGKVINTVPASAAFPKLLSPQSDPISISDPSPEASPNSLQESPMINSSIQASLFDAISRCNFAREAENKPVAHTPVVDHERKMVSVAIATSLCGKSVNESLASTRSITAAVQRYQEVRSRVPQRVISNASIKTCRSRSSSIFTAHTAASRPHVKIRRRRRRRADKGKASKPPSAVVPEERVNSAAKRRARREKMAARRRDRGSNHQYVHMTANLQANRARQ